MTTTLGIFADKPTSNTGMAIVNANLAHHLCRLDDELRVIYFARFGQDNGFAKMGFPYDGYEVVNCEGGVWQSSLIEKIIQKYKIDLVYSEDDWYSAYGLIEAVEKTKTPFYFLTPIDSLPIQKEAYSVFEKCNKVFIPNQSYRYIPNGVYLPHAVDWMIFKPICPKRFDKFTFLWIGRTEDRKNPWAVISAFEKICKKYDCGLIIRSDWTVPFAKGVGRYILNRKIPIIMDTMTNSPHEKMAYVYSGCHAYICSSKAGGFEMGTLEASACGLPILVTDWTFMCENVKDGVGGFLIPIESYDIRPKRSMTGELIPNTKGRIWGNISIDKLAERMTWMLENQEKVLKMGIDGLLWVRENFNWKDITEKLFDIIMDDQTNEN